jgi:hypothetical protein
VNVHGDSTAELHTGLVQDDLWTYDTSVVDMYGGTVGDVIGASNSSAVNIWGGAVTHLVIAHDLSNICLHGGTGGYLLGAAGSGKVDICGYNLVMTTTGGANGYGYVTGQWADWTSFTLDLYTAGTHTHVELHEIPEPATAALLALGGLLLMRGRKSAGRYR